MNCRKCKKDSQEGFLYDGKVWSIFDKESVGLELYDFFCRDCVEKILSLLIDEATDNVRSE